MDRDIDIITDVLLKVLEEKGIVAEDLPTRRDDADIPIGISNRHVHLKEEDLNICFGEGYEMTPIKDLSQPGQFACKETVTLCGPKGAIEKVRILGPLRAETQVELLAADNFKLGIKAPLRMSGDLEGSEPLTIVGPKGSVQIKQGAIVAQRHIHMTLDDADHYGVEDGQIVALEIPGDRGGVFTNVVIRANNKSALDCHIDVEEANAMGVADGTKGRIIK